MGEILVGVSSWTDPALIQSARFYPSWAKSAEGRLQYYASQFDLVEVDSSYYSMPSETTGCLWAQRTGEGFTFDVKGFRLLSDDLITSGWYSLCRSQAPYHSRQNHLLPSRGSRYTT